MPFTPMGRAVFRKGWNPRGRVPLRTAPARLTMGAHRTRRVRRTQPSSALPPMQILPVDITALVATILGISVVLIPVIGVTARFALKPTAEALSRFFDHQGLRETVRVLERRIDFQEHQIEGLEATVRRLSEAADFDRRLLGAHAEPRAALPEERPAAGGMLPDERPAAGAPVPFTPASPTAGAPS